MTLQDSDFLRAVGIQPYDLDEGMASLWKVEPKPDFIPPTYLQEYLACYPTGIRDAVGEVAGGMELVLPGGGLDALAQNIEKMFLDFLADDLEDVVALYEFHR